MVGVFCFRGYGEGRQTEIGNFVWEKKFNKILVFEFLFVHLFHHLILLVRIGVIIYWLEPSPKGEGFLFVGIRKMNGMGLIEFYLEKGCMTLLLCYGNPDKINTDDR